jgi:hypothetical protein
MLPSLSASSFDFIRYSLPLGMLGVNGTLVLVVVVVMIDDDN